MDTSSAKYTNQREVSCYNLCSRKRNLLKRKRVYDDQSEEQEMSREGTEQKHVERQETEPRPVNSKGSCPVGQIHIIREAGPFSNKNQSEPSCSFTTRKRTETQLKRSVMDDLFEEWLKKMVMTKQTHVTREGTASAIVEHANFFDLYTLGNQLGKGAYSSVCAGVRISDEKKVAIKCVLKELSTCVYLPCDRYSLPLEVALMKLVCKPPQCPYVIELLEWFETNTTFIFILERPEPCITLLDYCRTLQSQMPYALAQSIMQQLIQALCHCHDRGVFHRDIKLDNILFNTQTMEVKLIDFGYGFIRKDTMCTECEATSVIFPMIWICKDEKKAEFDLVRDLGLLLFSMLRGGILVFDDHLLVFKNDLSDACYSLIGWCLEQDLNRRPTLEQILTHEWFQN